MEPAKRNKPIVDLAEVDEKQKKSKLVVLIVIFLIILALAAGTLLWKTSNDRDVAQLAGTWYSESEGVQYHFLEDGTFFATNGQFELLAGTWSAGWGRHTLVLSYEIEGNPRRITTSYELDEDNKHLQLDNINDRALSLNRRE